MEWRLTFAALSSAVFMLSCTGPPATCELPSCSLRAAARAAKAMGKHAIGVTILSEGSWEGDLVELASSDSFVLVRATHTGPVIVHDAEVVYRWYVFDIIDALQRRRRDGECATPPRPALSVAPDQLAVAVSGGTVQVEGVDVTIVTRESSVAFEPARAYLLVGMLCGDDWLSLSRGAASVFEVTSVGTIRSQIGPKFQFSKEIESLGTVEALRAYLRAQ